MLQKTGNHHPRPFDPDAAVLRVRDAILGGELTGRDLSARTLASFLGLTTSVFYHHFGSFELFLYAVSISGLSLLADDVEALARARARRGDPLLGIADRYIELALDQPVLFDLMVQHPFPWPEIRARGRLDTREGLRAWDILVAAVRDAGSRDPLEDARLFHATMHGLATLARNGRMNIGDLEHSDREVALRTARRLVRVFRAWLTREPGDRRRPRTRPPRPRPATGGSRRGRA